MSVSFSLVVKEDTTTANYLQSVISKVEKKNMGVAGKLFHQQTPTTIIDRTQKSY